MPHPFASHVRPVGDARVFRARCLCIGCGWEFRGGGKDAVVQGQLHKAGSGHDVGVVLVRGGVSWSSPSN